MRVVVESTWFTVVYLSTLCAVLRRSATNVARPDAFDNFFCHWRASQQLSAAESSENEFYCRDESDVEPALKWRRFDGRTGVPEARRNWRNSGREESSEAKFSVSSLTCESVGCNVWSDVDQSVFLSQTVYCIVEFCVESHPTQQI